MFHLYFHPLSPIPDSKYIPESMDFISKYVSIYL